MKTHCDINIWICSDVEVEVQTSGVCAWAQVGQHVTIFAGEGDALVEDLGILEDFFRQGLAGVAAARAEQLTLVPAAEDERS